MAGETVPRLSWAEVCARRLERHGLDAPLPRARPADVVRAMGGVAHAQVLSAAELSIGLRTTGVTRADVRDALWTERTLVKTFGPRGTVHLLPAQDLPMWVGALSAAPRHLSSFPEDVRLTPDQTEAVLEAVAAALEDAELTVDELTEAVVEHAGPWAGDLVMPAFQGLWPRWRQALHLAGMRGVLCFGPTRGRKVTYTSPRRWLPGFQPADGPTSLAGVVRGYLHAYGPATPQQFAHWLDAPRQWAAALFDSLAGELDQVEVDGTLAWVAVGDTTAPAGRAARRPAAALLRRLRLRGRQPAARAAVSGPSRRARARELPGAPGRRGGRRRVAAAPLRPEARPHGGAAGPAPPARRRELDEQVERVGMILEGTPQLTIGTVTVGSHA